MKRLFIYYSHTGCGDLVATDFSKSRFDIRKVIEKKKMPKSFFMQMMVGGFRAGISAKGKLVDYDPDVKDYEEIVIGSPIWNGKIPPAINGVLANTDLSNKKLTFVFYSGSGEGKGALKKVNKLYKDADALFLKQPNKYPEELKKLASLLGK